MPSKTTNKDLTKKHLKLYKVEFWRQNNDWRGGSPTTLVFSAYIRADSEGQALSMLKSRLRDKARETNKTEDHENASLFSRDDITPYAKETYDWREIDRMEAKDLKGSLGLQSKCQQCGGTLDDDYCQDCGWRRQSWFSKAMEEQGKMDLIGERQ